MFLHFYIIFNVADLNSIGKDLFPNDIIKFQTFGDFDDFLHPFCFQIGIIGDILVFHVLRNLRIGFPTVERYFVPAQMQIVILEHTFQLRKQFVD